MKKTLYGTTALVAASVIGASSASADGIELGLGGYMHTLFSVGGIDEQSGSSAKYNATGLWSDGEIYFRGRYKHDNGITFGVQVELEATSTSDQIDERYIFVEGDFGRIVAGSENSAAYIMHYAAPFAGIPINSGWVTVFIPQPSSMEGMFRSPTGSTYIDIGNDENLITYYTPRFAGFQFGVSYIPAVAQGSPPNGQAGSGQNFPVEANNNAQYNNGVSVGANYVQDFDGFGVAISAGYRWAQKPDDPKFDDYNNYQAVSAGVNVSLPVGPGQTITVGGSYANVLDGAPYNWSTPGSSNEGQSWDAGVTYGLGPWLFGVTYFQGHTDGFTALGGRDEMTAIVGGLNYQLGPGILARGAVLWGEYNPEEGGGGTQSGVVGIAGLSFTF